ncbi:MAG: hypothetical protein LJE95_09105 [Acidobacteria bacterium]|nr:hypothetical protein [Acidobacteriota bacterium]
MATRRTVSTTKAAAGTRKPATGTPAGAKKPVAARASGGAKRPTTRTPTGGAKKPAAATASGGTKKPVTRTATGGTRKPVAAAASGGAKKPMTPAPTGGGEKPAPATKSGAAAKPKKPTLSDRAAETAERLQQVRIALETTVMRFQDRVGGELDRVRKELAGSKPPSKKVLRRIMKRIDEVKLKPAKGRVKDFVRLEDLAEDLADLVPPGDTTSGG